MPIILCDISSYGLWFGDQEVSRRISAASLVSDVPGASASRRLPERELAMLGVTARPVHLLVAEHRLQRQSRDVVSHLWQPPRPRGTIVRLSKEVYALSPVACLVQMAARLDDVCLLRDLFHLCGAYRTWNGEVLERRPLSCRHEVWGYLRLVRGRRGVLRLRRLAGHVLDGSASPLETAAALLLTLPEEMGGYGLPEPVLNDELLLHSPVAREVRRPDISWPDRGVDVEVLSKKFHGSPDRLGPDSARKTHLQRAGMRVFDLTAYQMGRREEMDCFVASVRDALGLGPLIASPSSSDGRRRRLVEELLGRSSGAGWS